MWIFFFVMLTLFFVNFWGLSLPCHLLCCLLLFACFFVVVCFSFFFPSWIFCFLPSWIFWGFFVSLIALCTSSLRLVMSPWGLVAQRLRFEDGYRRVVSYTIDDLGKRVA